MPRKLVVVMANSDPRNPEELGTPLVHAAVAAAMDYEVEVICAGTAGRLLKKGVAEGLVVKPGGQKTVYDFIREACEHGVKFYACPMNLDLFDMREEDLVPECRGLLGAAALIARIMEDDCRVLSY
ncbi:MAG TPA: DsrE/DsrF/DrsH-like family protein [Stellaceae bacterium]|nr:DsrE/DsrF/DrsH-like family protein [Stellaceae bacterium]